MLKVDLGKFQLKNPILTASGTYGYNNEFDEFMDVSQLGAIITKAITLLPRNGNNNSRIAETKAGMINSIGLENVGIEKFISEKLPVLKEKNINYIMNLAGSEPIEYVKLAKICEDNEIKAVELNVSCPNVKSGCMEIGVDEKALYSLVSEIREVYSGFLAVKLTPNITRIENTGTAAEKAGADALCAINTLKGTSIKLQKTNEGFKKTVLTGGYSGVGIKPAALNAVMRLAQVVNIPIIGIGGIETLEDVLEFFAAGAAAVQIGTANFTHPDIAGRLVSELEEFITTNNYKDLENLKRELRA